MMVLRVLNVIPSAVHVDSTILKLEARLGKAVIRPLQGLDSFVDGPSGNDVTYVDIITITVGMMYIACGLMASSAVAVAAASTYNMAGMLKIDDEVGVEAVECVHQVRLGQPTDSASVAVQPHARGAVNSVAAGDEALGVELHDRAKTARHLGFVLCAVSLSYLANASMGVISTTIMLGELRNIRTLPVATYLRYLFTVPAVNAVVTEVVESHAELLARRGGCSPKRPRPEPRIAYRDAAIYFLAASTFVLGRFLPSLCVASLAIWVMYGVKLYLSAYQDLEDTKPGVPAEQAFLTPRLRGAARHRKGSAWASGHESKPGQARADLPACAHEQLLGLEGVDKVRLIGTVTMSVSTCLELTAQLAPWAPVRGVAASFVMLVGMAGTVLLPLAYVQYRLLALTEAAVLHERLAAMHANEAAGEAADEARRRFLRYVMHEARVPANAIRLGLDSLALEADDMPEDAQEVVEEMREAAAAQAALFNSVLDLAKLESSHFTLNKERTRIEEVLNRCNRTVAPCAAAAGARVTLHVEDAARHTLVSMDTARIEQVVANFMANAVKCLPKDGSGYVTVRASCASHGASRRSGQATDEAPQRLWHSTTDGHKAGDSWLRVDVTDNGSGIPQTEQGKLFQPYVQIAGSNKTVQGTGLGLIIGKHIVEAHGGRIGFTSEEGQGSNFWFELPLTSASHLGVAGVRWAADGVPASIGAGHVEHREDVAAHPPLAVHRAAHSDGQAVAVNDRPQQTAGVTDVSVQLQATGQPSAQAVTTAGGATCCGPRPARHTPRPHLTVDRNGHHNREMTSWTLRGDEQHGQDIARQPLLDRVAYASTGVGGPDQTGPAAAQRRGLSPIGRHHRPGSR